MTGFYLALEGGEGAGKTTVAALLQDLLEERGERVTLVREPGGTELGDAIRMLVLHSIDMTPWAEAMLFAAQRAQLVAEIVAPALERGDIVVSDRSLYSSLAYQSGGRGLVLEDVLAANLLAVGRLVPELVVVLGVDPEVGRSRQEVPDRIGREHDQFQKRVANAYRRLAEADPGRVTIVPAGDNPEAVAKGILELIDQRRVGK
ncbi:MAG TPA: dTMP kinase [Acidimicrobiia bacterium]|jgi:dTMP kinase|nr:dTMP kinase [Acidimicrobiia bacterium]